MMDWISVEDKLPEETNKKYFVVTSYGADTATYYDTGDGTNHIYWAKFENKERFPLTVPVTHWMPLPQTPRET